MRDNLQPDGRSRQDPDGNPLDKADASFTSAQLRPYFAALFDDARSLAERARNAVRGRGAYGTQVSSSDDGLTLTAEFGDCHIGHFAITATVDDMASPDGRRYCCEITVAPRGRIPKERWPAAIRVSDGVETMRLDARDVDRLGEQSTAFERRLDQVWSGCHRAALFSAISVLERGAARMHLIDGA